MKTTIRNIVFRAALNIRAARQTAGRGIKTKYFFSLWAPQMCLQLQDQLPKMCVYIYIERERKKEKEERDVNVCARVCLCPSVFVVSLVPA